MYRCPFVVCLSNGRWYCREKKRTLFEASRREIRRTAVNCVAPGSVICVRYIRHDERVCFIRFAIVYFLVNIDNQYLCSIFVQYFGKNLFSQKACGVRKSTNFTAKISIFPGKCVSLVQFEKRTVFGGTRTPPFRDAVKSAVGERRRGVATTCLPAGSPALTWFADAHG